jgi:hypothetical protein
MNEASLCMAVSVDLLRPLPAGDGMTDPVHIGDATLYTGDVLSVLAGCPEHSCPKCGAPWVKDIEKSGGTTGKSWHDHTVDLEQGQRDEGHQAARGWDSGDYHVRVLGEHPTCTCGLPAIGGTVLDPFGGSGTTAEVALEYGRRAILIELKPEYVELQKRRLAPVAGRPMLDFTEAGRW